MKIKLIVVDLQLSRLQKRIGLGVLGLATIAAASVALAMPTTFVSGQVLKAADLNANFVELNARLTTLEATKSDVEVRGDAIVQRASDDVR
jgi:hypothetical protein